MSTPEETAQLKAGHPPAVKAGGMRITQHKTGHVKESKDVVHSEDLTGLAGIAPVPINPVLTSGAPNKGNTDFTPQAAQVAHSPKPPAHINIKPATNIQQPRK
ncbi:death-associated protein 1 [Danaus plexippus]|uniref:death-associated protein 1 n=1 Tax=Danaus plexippus TaxID=13037 RepID=UPI002AB2578C|nr:death-associated protein 1 [Danaus plexippus]